MRAATLAAGLCLVLAAGHGANLAPLTATSRPL
jgi:hypothetical protein